MKRKHLFLLAFSLLFVVFSCVKDNVVDISRKLPQEPQPPATSGNTISMDSLRSLALNLPAIFSQQPQTRSTGKTIKEIVSLSSFFNQPATRTATVSGKNPVSDIYVVNYSGDAGFAIISADTRLVDVLAYSDYGNINDTLDNPGVKLFMSGVYDYADYMLNYLPEKGDSVAVHGMVLPKNSATTASRGYTGQKTLSAITEYPYVNENPYYPPEDDDGYYYRMETVEEQSDWTGTVKGPFVEVKWGQYTPYNNNMFECSMMGRAPAGCVPTAMAQIMSYHEWPLFIDQSSDFLHWDIWKLYFKHYKDFKDQNSPDETNRIATLFEDLGTLVNINYKCSGSSASFTDANAAFNTNTLGYNTDGIISYSPSQVRTDLRNNRPVFVGGHKENDETGHVWVVDGYKDQQCIWMELAYWYRNEGGDTPEELIVIDTLRAELFPRNYVHCNWGWDGISNGWFYDNILLNPQSVFKTNKPEEKDPDTEYYNMGQYSINVKMIKNLRRK